MRDRIVVVIFFGVLFLCFSGCAGCGIYKENVQRGERIEQLEKELKDYRDAKTVLTGTLKAHYTEDVSFNSARVKTYRDEYLGFEGGVAKARKNAKDELKDEWGKLEKEKIKLQEKMTALVLKEAALKSDEDKLAEGERNFAKKKAPTELLERIKENVRDYFDFCDQAEIELISFPGHRPKLVAIEKKLRLELRSLLIK